MKAQIKTLRFLKDFVGQSGTNSQLNSHQTVEHYFNLMELSSIQVTRNFSKGLPAILVLVLDDVYLFGQLPKGDGCEGSTVLKDSCCDQLSERILGQVLTTKSLKGLL